MTRAEADVDAVFLGEWPRGATALEIEDTEGRRSDGRAKHGADALRLHALVVAKTRILERARRADRLAGGEGLRDDAR